MNNRENITIGCADVVLTPVTQDWLIAKYGKERMWGDILNDAINSLPAIAEALKPFACTHMCDDHCAEISMEGVTCIHVKAARALK